MKKKLSTNFEGLIVFLLFSFVFYMVLFVFLRIKQIDEADMDPYITFFIFFVFVFFLMWQIVKRLNSPILSDTFMFFTLTLYNAKAILGLSAREAFNPWISLWLFSPFVLLSCKRGEGVNYLKKYLLLPVLFDAVVLMHTFFIGGDAMFSIGLKHTGVIRLMALLCIYSLFFFCFVQYTKHTYGASFPCRSIPIKWLVVPAFTGGIFFTVLFFLAF
jgi:hypothetical protein